MPSNQVDQIKDPEIRELMARASSFMDQDKNYDCVRACADAYLLLLQKYPQVRAALDKVIDTPRVKAGLELEMIRFAPLMWPRMAAKLHLEGPEPEIVFDRQFVGFGETIQYYEFMHGLVAMAQEGNLEAAMQQAAGGAGLG
jgi:hypothetical protein